MTLIEILTMTMNVNATKTLPVIWSMSEKQILKAILKHC